MKAPTAVAWEKEQAFSMEEWSSKSRTRREVLIRVVGVGVCHADLTVRDQGYPVPLR